MLLFRSKWIHDGLAVCLLPEATGPNNMKSSATMQTDQHPREIDWDAINVQ